MDTGTGAVHTAPAHGADDFNTGVRYGIPIHSDVDEAGILRNGLPEYEGLQVFKANAAIIELLRNRGVLLGLEKIEHSYPHCWRCHNPIIFRATEQWFIAMDEPMPNGSNLRTRSLREIKKVKWDPAWGEERISNMVAGRPDWCISRQRVWGVPIAMFQCGDCNQFLNDHAVNHSVVELFAREGADSWYRYSPEQLLSAEQNARTAGRRNSAKKWTSSTFGSSPDRATPPCSATSRDFPGPLIFISKAAISIAAGSSLRCSAGSRRAARLPIRTCATVGWVLDPQGRAQSKSLATSSIRWKSPTSWARRSSACGSPPSTSART